MPGPSRLPLWATITSIEPCLLTIFPSQQKPDDPDDSVGIIRNFFAHFRFYRIQNKAVQTFSPGGSS